MSGILLFFDRLFICLCVHTRRGILPSVLKARMFSHGGQHYYCIKIRFIANTILGITITFLDIAVKVKHCDLYQFEPLSKVLFFLLGTIVRPNKKPWGSVQFKDFFGFPCI
jgi:hypothetical protein